MINKPLLYASTALVSLGLVTTAGTNNALAQQQQQAEDEITLEEIVVTGTYIRRSQVDTPSPLQVIGQDDLLDLGANDIADLTQTLTINNGAQNNPDAFTQNRTPGTSNINLRGLGVSSTLVLLNGKRQVVSAANTDGGNLFVDTASLVPLIAVDRVEIIEDGAASLYGSDAVAGVANFITRDEFEGFEVQGDFQFVTDEGTSRDLRVSGIYGWGNDRTHWTVAASYLDRTMLDTRERDLRPERFRGANGLSVNEQAAQPGNFVVAGFPTSDQQTNGALLTAFDNTLPFFLFPDASLFNPQLGQALPNGSFLSPFPALLGGAGPAFGNFIGFGGLTDGLPLQDLNGPVPGFDNIIDFFTNQPSALTALANGPLAGTPFAGFFSDPSFASQFGSQAQTIDGFMNNFQANNAGTGLFGAPIIPDPQCAEAAAISDDVFLDEPRAQDGHGLVDLGTCQSDFGTHFSHVPEEERFQLYSSLRQDLADRHRFYADFSYANNEAARQTTQFPITSPLPIASNNPFNPFGVPLLFVGRSPGLNQLDPDNFFVDDPNTNFFEYDTWRINAGFEGDLSETWYYDISVVRGSNEWHLLSLDGLASNTTLALNGLGGEGCDPSTGVPGVGPCQFYNPFISGVLAPEGATAPFTLPNGSVVQVPIRNSPEILEFITEPLSIDGDSRLWTVDGVVSGDLFDLPEGPVGIAFGAQWRKERLAHDNSEELEQRDFLFVVGQDDFDSSRDVYALFTEINVPLFRNFELQGALRFEDYGSLVGDTLDPKLAALYRPADWLAMRASWGTSFRAPSIFQQFGNATSLNSVVDPRDGSSSFFAIRTIGNPQLAPEESENFNAGVTIEPVPDLRLNVDYWRFEFEDVIVEQSPDELARRALDPSDPNFDPSLLGDVVFLGPTGALTRINTEFINAAFIDTDGFDFGAEYTWDTNAGVFRLSGEATMIKDYKIPGAQVPGVTATTIDVVDSRNRLNFADPVPKWRFNLNAAWAYEGHQALIFLRYIDGFTNDEACAQGNGDFTNPVQGNCPSGTAFQQIDSHTTVDVQYSYTINGVGPADSVTITAGATNLFDKAPPFVFTDGAFETRTHDPRGRMAYLRVRAGF